MSCKHHNVIEIDHVPNHFFEPLADSMTSTIPARRGSMVATWFARIPISPVAAHTFTWVTSADVKMAYRKWPL